MQFFGAFEIISDKRTALNQFLDFGIVTQESFKSYKGKLNRKKITNLKCS